jgi:RNA polymerase sigma-70 factor (ECF subfamily)
MNTEYPLILFEKKGFTFRQNHVNNYEVVLDIENQNISLESQLKTWIYRIALNKSNELIRRKGRKKRSGKMIPIENDSLILKSNQQTPLEQLEYKELEVIFRINLTKIPENQQIAFMLNRFEGLNYQEIAAEMKTTHSAVESLLFRAKKKLTELMHKHTY